MSESTSETDLADRTGGVVLSGMLDSDNGRAMLIVVLDILSRHPPQEGEDDTGGRVSTTTSRFIVFSSKYVYVIRLLLSS